VNALSVNLTLPGDVPTWYQVISLSN